MAKKVMTPEDKENRNIALAIGAGSIRLSSTNS